MTDSSLKLLKASLKENVQKEVATGYTNCHGIEIDLPHSYLSRTPLSLIQIPGLYTVKLHYGIQWNQLFFFSN